MCVLILKFKLNFYSYTSPSAEKRKKNSLQRSFVGYFTCKYPAIHNKKAISLFKVHIHGKVFCCAKESERNYENSTRKRSKVREEKFKQQFACRSVSARRLEHISQREILDETNVMGLKSSGRAYSET